MAITNESALHYWGAAYDAITKSVFALAAWHLSSACGEEDDSDLSAALWFHAVIEALKSNGLISGSQAAVALRAVKKLTEEIAAGGQ